MIDLSGKLITFEGIDGCGKTTQVEAVAENLKDLGHDVVVTREPGGTQIGQKIRRLLLDPGSDSITSMCEMLLYYADRVQHMNDVLKPALEQGKTVLCDRYYDSTYVYQAVNNDLEDAFQKLQDVAGEYTPDVTILISINPQIALGRMRTRDFDALSRFDLKNKAFHDRIADAYESLAAKNSDRFVIVDGSQDQHKVTQDIMAMINLMFKAAA